MHNAIKLSVPESVESVVGQVIDERTASGLTLEQVFDDENLWAIADEAMRRTGVSLENPRTKRAAERFVCIALSNYATDHQIDN